MDIDFFFPETVTIEHVTGSTTSGIRAQIQKSNEILLWGDKTVVSVDDVIVHDLKNGAVHRYSVEDATYHRAVGGHLPATTMLKVRKHGIRDSGSPRGQHVYNVSGNNARINVNSTDQSTNVVSVSPSPVFEELRAALETLPRDHPHRGEILALAGSLSTTQPHTATFTERFQQFMALAANCMTVVTPFVPELVKMLGHQ